MRIPGCGRFLGGRSKRHGRLDILPAGSSGSTSPDSGGVASDLGVDGGHQRDGALVFYLSVGRHRIIQTVTRAYISFFIGTPLIVLLFLMYYGLPQWGLKIPPFWVAVIGFTLNVAAYNAAYLTTAFHGLDPAEIEAAQAQGFGHFQIFRLIILPQVLRSS
ncbi:MAG: ABC transporter permease subunit, partial [Verrucomicrobia bacterium]|nr:ABC transporter permease subunit [Verrucomicrobiota bacterium]